MSSKTSHRQSSCGELADLDLNSRTGGFSGGFKQAGGNFSIDIFFTAVGSDAGWNAFEDQSGSAFVQSHCGFAKLCFTLLTNNTPHVVFLLLKSDSHSVKSGS
jgi:hypothetical protein